MAAEMVARLPGEVMGLDAQIAEINALIEARFREHPLAAVIISLPGLGPVLGAEFVAATGCDGSLLLGQPSGGFRRPCTRAPRLRPHQRQPAPTPPLPPRPAPRLLPVLDGQHPRMPGLAHLLRPQARSRQDPHPGPAGPVQTPCQRPVGHDPRQSVLSRLTGHRSRGLTTSLRCLLRYHFGDCRAAG